MNAPDREALAARLSREDRALLRVALDEADRRDQLAQIAEWIGEHRPGRASEPSKEQWPEVMGAEDAARYTGIGINRVRRLLRTHAIPSRTDGRGYLVRRESLDAWMAEEEQRQSREHLHVLGSSSRGRRAS